LSGFLNVFNSSISKVSPKILTQEIPVSGGKDSILNDGVEHETGNNNK
jgi:hypothetical protein